MTAHTPPQVISGGGKVAIPLTIGMAFLIEQIDSTAIIAALATISRDFGVAPQRLNLAVTSYLFALAVFMPTSGWVADRFGARRVFLVAVAAFAMGSALCGLAVNLPMLIVARVLQGIGGAFMTPIGRLILLRSSSKAELVTAITLMTVPVLLGPLIGPVLGGFFVSYVHWRWIFFINLPITALIVFMALRVIAPIPRAATPRFDIGGFALSASGLLLLQVALENVTGGFMPTGLAWGAVVAGILLLGLFWQLSRRREHSLLDLSLFGLRPFQLGLTAGGLCRIGLNAVPFLLQLRLQLDFGYSAFQAGATVFVTAIGALALKPLNRRILRVTGFKRLLIANGLVTAILTAGMAFFTQDTPLWVFWIYLAAFGLFRSLQFNSINSLTYSEVPERQHSASVGLASSAQQLTMGLGVSISATVYTLWGGPALQGTFDGFAASFLIMALFPILSAILFLRLGGHDGAEASGYR
jgi:EmrB/QacA subfamily drug resistance transporter